MILMNTAKNYGHFNPSVFITVEYIKTVYYNHFEVA